MGGMSGGHDLPNLTWGSFFSHWQLHPVWLLGIAVVLVAYLVSDLGSARRVRAASFVAGCLLLAWTVSSGVEVYAHSMFWMHMVQHLLLITVVPALLVIGRPLTVAARNRPRVAAVLRSPSVSVLTHPATGLALYTATVVGTHLTGFMDQMMTVGWLTWGEQLLYLAAGFLVLLPALGESAIRWQLPALGRLVLLVLAMIPDTVVGIVLLQSETNPFPTMLTGDHPWAPDPVRDVHIGGGLMWVGGDGLMMVLAVGVILALVTSSGKDSPVGSWMEGVRRSTLLTQTTPADSSGQALADDVDVDDDDAVLDAYNSMLRRMNDH